jgi:hypothetical protein
MLNLAASSSSSILIGPRIILIGIYYCFYLKYLKVSTNESKTIFKPTVK